MQTLIIKITIKRCINTNKKPYPWGILTKNIINANSKGLLLS
jgi:hypothetical protein